MAVECQEFELNGVTFERPRTFSPGTDDLRILDVDRPGGDGLIVGTDYQAAPVWTWELAIASEGEIADLAAAWRPPVRPVAAALTALRYKSFGRWRRVYGRPGRFTPPSPGTLEMAVGAETLLCDFRLADPLHYSDVSGSVSLGIVPAVRSSWVFPMVPPFTWTSPVGAPQSRTAVVGGDVATPVRVTFQGPIVQPWVEVGGVRVETLGTLAFDEAVTVDARTMTVTRQDGASVPGFVAPRTRLAELRLPPGSHEITFGGTDVTGTATATVEWSDAWRSL